MTCFRQTHNCYTHQHVRCRRWASIFTPR